MSFSPSSRFAKRYFFTSKINTMNTQETQTGQINKGVAFSRTEGEVRQPKEYPLGIHTDEYGRTFTQTRVGRIYGTTKNV